MNKSYPSQHNSRITRTVLQAALFGLMVNLVIGQTEFQVTNSGTSAYLIDGVANPSLVFMRDSTYIFHVNAPGHPFWIKTVQSTGSGNAYNNGVTGNGVQQGDLVFTVPADAPDQLYYNCEFHVNMTGDITVNTTVSVSGTDPLPRTFSLQQNFPNPFNPVTTIQYRIPARAPVELIIYDLSGKRLRTLVNTVQEVGVQTAFWDGKNEQGQVVAAGVYVYHLQVGGNVESRRMTLLK